MAKICLQCRYFYHGHSKKPSLCTNRHSNKFPNKLRRDGHSSVCKHFRPPKHKHDSSASGQFTGKLRFVESLRGNYPGREIWVLATGPSLDDIPQDFLEVDETIPPDENGKTVPKICIAVKEAAIAFPDCTYNIWPFRSYGLRHVYLPRGKIPSKFGKFIFSLRPQDRDNYFGEQSSKAIFMKYTQGGTVEKMRGMCEAIVAGNSSTYFGVGTITHLAIAAALVMGASRVSLVGCDHGTVDGKSRFQRGMSGGYGWDRPAERVYELMHIGTNFLGNFFSDQGIEIARYHHGKGYESVRGLKEDPRTIKKAERIWKGRWGDPWKEDRPEDMQ